MSDKKYSFLLVDDEAIIREGITERINWEEEGFHFLPPCSDGIEAIEAIKKYQPHVVLTDICMPRADGIEVARFINENYPDTIVFILSGYDDFEYARQALRYNVNEYLLKPISARTLLGHLEKVREELKRQESFKNQYKHLLKQADENREIIRERFLCRLISRPVSRTEMGRYKPLLPFESWDSFYNAVVCEIDGEEGSSHPGMNRDVYLLAVQGGCETLLKERDGASLVFQTSEGRLVILLERAQERDCRIESRLMADEVHSHFQSTPGYTLSVGVGSPCQGLSLVGDSYAKALSALEYRLLVGKNSVFYYSHKKETFGNWEVNGYPKIIREALRYKSQEETSRIVTEFCNKLRSSSLSTLRIRHEISRVVFAIIYLLENIGMEEGASESSELIDSLGTIPSMDDLAEIEIALLACLDRISQNLQTRRQNYPEKKIFEIRKYLEERFFERTISSESVAAHFNISISYLGKLFRRYLGKSFLEYLTSLRMDRACELLKQTDLTGQEIAEKCGFGDSRYFSSSFKKYTGKTPSQYRTEL